VLRSSYSPVRDFNHAYYLDNPSESSNLIRVLLSNCKPASPDRPLTHIQHNFWEIPPDYPNIPVAGNADTQLRLPAGVETLPAVLTKSRKKGCKKAKIVSTYPLRG